MAVTPYNLTDGLRAMSIATRANVTTAGDTIDRADSNGGVMFAILSGTITDGTHTFTIQDSDDGSTWAGANAAYIQGTAVFGAADDDVVKELGYNGPKRYVRLSVTGTGSTTGGAYGAVATLSGGRKPLVR